MEKIAGYGEADYTDRGWIGKDVFHGSKLTYDGKMDASFVYRGCKLSVVHKSLGSHLELFWTAYDQNGYEIITGYGEYTDVASAANGLIGLVDRFHEDCEGDPQQWEMEMFGRVISL
jgi:hypothetical protein